MTVAGISPQGNARHHAFSEQNRLPFLLLVDDRRRAIRAYGVDGPFGLVRRVTYLVATNGVIQERLIADLLVGRHIQFIRRLVNEAE